MASGEKEGNDFESISLPFMRQYLKNRKDDSEFFEKSKGIVRNGRHTGGV